jgi:hypothetical protein
LVNLLFQVREFSRYRTFKLFGLDSLAVDFGQGRHLSGVSSEQGRSDRQ